MKMKNGFQISPFYLETIKWLLIFLLSAIAIIGNYIYNNFNFSLRVLFIVLILVIIGSIFLTTVKGKIVITFAREAHTEIRKVIWPSYQETFHTTLIISAVTAIMSLILWGLDGILIRIISFITNFRF